MPDASRADISELPALPAVTAFVQRVLPGRSTSNTRMQRQILEFGSNPMARAVLLRGPIGSGKSTIARVIALLKRATPLSMTAAEEFLKYVPFTGPNQINLNYLNSWYVELALTGLVEPLADTQLFGSVRSAYTGAENKPGVFELAASGRVSKGETPAGARVTNGVVFLDEIGDLPKSLQAKLLPVLSNGAFYRVGNEGKDELVFRGVTITASWKDLGGDTLRPDLLSRIAPYVIDIPGIDDRIEDFDLLLDAVEAAVITQTKNCLTELSGTDPDIARGYWVARKEDLRPLASSDREFLQQVAWGPRANLRGLTAAVEQILSTGADAKSVVSGLPIYDMPSPESNIGGDLFHRLVNRSSTGDGLGSHVKALEREGRKALRSRLQSDQASLVRLSKCIGIEPEKLRTQVRDLDRDRSGGEEG